jgi:hypothetical protein
MQSTRIISLLRMLLSSSLLNCLQPFDTSSLLGLDILLSTLFSKIHIHMCRCEKILSFLKVCTSGHFVQMWA